MPLSASDYLPLKHMDVLNVENARSYFPRHPDCLQIPCPSDFSRSNQMNMSTEFVIPLMMGRHLFQPMK
jgi:hypothetical protein